MHGAEAGSTDGPTRLHELPGDVLGAVGVRLAPHELAALRLSSRQLCYALCCADGLWCSTPAANTTHTTASTTTAAPAATAAATAAPAAYPARDGNADRKEAGGGAHEEQARDVPDQQAGGEQADAQAGAQHAGGALSGEQAGGALAGWRGYCASRRASIRCQAPAQILLHLPAAPGSIDGDDGVGGIGAPTASSAPLRVPVPLLLDLVHGGGGGGGGAWRVPRPLVACARGPGVMWAAPTRHSGAQQYLPMVLWLHSKRYLSRCLCTAVFALVLVPA